jgi:hypothetical protein
MAEASQQQRRHAEQVTPYQRHHVQLQRDVTTAAAAAAAAKQQDGVEAHVPSKQPGSPQEDAAEQYTNQAPDGDQQAAGIKQRHHHHQQQQHTEVPASEQDGTVAATQWLPNQPPAPDHETGPEDGGKAQQQQEQQLQQPSKPRPSHFVALQVSHNLQVCDAALLLMGWNLLSTAVLVHKFMHSWCCLMPPGG